MLTINWQCRVATNLQFVKKKKKTTILQSTIKQGMPIITLPAVGIKGCKVRIVHFTQLDEMPTGVYILWWVILCNTTCRTTAT